MYVNHGSGQEGILFWGLTPYNTNAQINNYKTTFGVTNPCAGLEGGGPAAVDIVSAGQGSFGYPSYCVICPDRTLYFDVCFPPTEDCFDQYFNMCMPLLSIEPSIRNVPAQEGVTTFEVSSTSEWTVSENVSWLSVTLLGGSGNKTMKVNYETNITGFTRSGSISVTVSGSAQTQVVTVSQVSHPNHMISLSEGWNGLSSYLMPALDDIVEVFDPVSGKFVIASTLSGIYYPSGALNTIVDWESQSAYQVKMNAPTVFRIFGAHEANKTLNLSAGWNIMPVICNYPLDAASILGSLDLELAKEIAGTGIFWPEMDINTIGDLEPGKAYLIYINSDGSITFPSNSE